MLIAFFRTASLATRLIGAAIALALLLGGLFLLQRGSKEPILPSSNVPERTNFVEIGTLTFSSSGGQDVPYLQYGAPGAPVTTTQLTLDEESICATPTGALPCMAMSVQYSLVFGGKRAIVEAVEKETVIRVKKLRILAEGEEPRLPEKGAAFISWVRAVELIRACEANMIVQAHGLTVYLTLKNGDRVQAVEPGIDEVFAIYEDIRPICNNTQLATE